MKILHTVGSLGEGAGGPSRTVPSLCRSLQQFDTLEIQISTANSSRFGANRVLDELPVIESDSRTTSEWTKSLAQTIHNRGSETGAAHLILHDHGQWLPVNRASARIARDHKIPRVVTPRGMLSPWAMSFRRWKKQGAWHWFGHRDIASANVIHATSELEAAELRDLGLTNPIAVIPNGVDVPTVDLQKFAKKQQAVFLSRLHPKKGVCELVKAWRDLRPQDWELILAGPDEAGMLRSLRLNNEEGIRYIGEVEGEDKWRHLAESSLFVLPSYSENFGVVVAESLTAGTPVITTHGTPWSSLDIEKCGWWIEMTPDSLASTLQVALSRSLTDLAAMGMRGQVYANRDFGWTSIAAEMKRVYEWMLDSADVPDCIQFA
tara:strand:+ start:21886 stop:23016 length:1131 start_codon:yes stop_codon:yes gene_type:complete